MVVWFAFVRHAVTTILTYTRIFNRQKGITVQREREALTAYSLSSLISTFSNLFMIFNFSFLCIIRSLV